MTAVQLVIVVAVAALLAMVWFRNRRTARNRSVDPDADVPGRGVIGEVVTAYEDVGRQFINERCDRPLRPDASIEADDKD